MFGERPALADLPPDVLQRVYWRAEFGGNEYAGNDRWSTRRFDGTVQVAPPPDPPTRNAATFDSGLFRTYTLDEIRAHTDAGDAARPALADLPPDLVAWMKWTAGPETGAYPGGTEFRGGAAAIAPGDSFWVRPGDGPRGWRYAYGEVLAYDPDALTAATVAAWPEGLRAWLRDAVDECEDDESRRCGDADGAWRATVTTELVSVAIPGGATENRRVHSTADVARVLDELAAGAAKATDALARRPLADLPEGVWARLLWRAKGALGEGPPRVGGWFVDAGDGDDSYTVRSDGEDYGPDVTYTKGEILAHAAERRPPLASLPDYVRGWVAKCSGRFLSLDHLPRTTPEQYSIRRAIDGHVAIAPPAGAGYSAGVEWRYTPAECAAYLDAAQEPASRPAALPPPPLARPALADLPLDTRRCLCWHAGVFAHAVKPAPGWRVVTAGLAGCGEPAHVTRLADDVSWHYTAAEIRAHAAVDASLIAEAAGMRGGGEGSWPQASLAELPAGALERAYQAAGADAGTALAGAPGWGVARHGDQVCVYSADRHAWAFFPRAAVLAHRAERSGGRVDYMDLGDLPAPVLQRVRFYAGMHVTDVLDADLAGWKVDYAGPVVTVLASGHNVSWGYGHRLIRDHYAERGPETAPLPPAPPNAAEANPRPISDWSLPVREWLVSFAGDAGPPYPASADPDWLVHRHGEWLDVAERNGDAVHRYDRADVLAYARAVGMAVPGAPKAEPSTVALPEASLPVAPPPALRQAYRVAPTTDIVTTVDVGSYAADRVSVRHGARVFTVQQALDALDYAARDAPAMKARLDAAVVRIEDVQRRAETIQALIDAARATDAARGVLAAPWHLHPTLPPDPTTPADPATTPEEPSTMTTTKDTTTPAPAAPSHARELLNTALADGQEAAWRTAASQFIKLTREPLVAAVSRHLAPDDEGVRAKVAAFLDTPVGGALFAGALSVALTAMPAAAGERVARLAHELRVRAMADGGDIVADLLMGPMRQVFADWLRDAPGVRVAVVDAVASAPLGEPVARIGVVDARTGAVATNGKGR